MGKYIRYKSLGSISNGFGGWGGERGKERK